MNITSKIVLEGRELSNGNHRVYLRIIMNRKKKNISLGLECKKENFVNESFTKKHPNNQIENEVLMVFKNKAYRIIRELQLTNPNFSLDDFEHEFKGKKKNSEVNVIEFFSEVIDEMTRSGRIGNAYAYKGTRDSLIKYSSKNLIFRNITPVFLEKYEVFLKENGNENGGVAFKMRELRALFNMAIKRKIIPKYPYPFEDYKVSKLKTESKKTAIALEELQKFKKVDLTNHPHLLEAYNYFLFSIYTRGMNFQDMMNLKWDNIKDGRIYYVRSKTKGKINQEIIQSAQDILDYYKAQNRQTNYVFPILLSDDLTPNQIHNRKCKVLRRYNKKLKEIAKLAGIDKHLTSYVARHSFATILKMKGASIEKISEMLGHRDVSTTNAYLKEFSNEDLDEVNRKFDDI